MNGIDFVFLLLLVVTVILATVYEAVTLWWVTGNWVGLRRLGPMILLFSLGVSIVWMFPESTMLQILGWTIVAVGAIVFGAVPPVWRILSRRSSRRG